MNSAVAEQYRTAAGLDEKPVHHDKVKVENLEPTGPDPDREPHPNDPNRPKPRKAAAKKAPAKKAIGKK